MRDHVARELKGHNILAVERFQDKTRWMVEFCLCHKGIYAQCTSVYFYYTRGIEKKRKMEITCPLCP